MLSKHTSAYSFNLASKANHFTIIRVAIVQVFWHWLLLLLISWTYFLPTWPKAFYSCEAPLNKFLFSIRYFASLWWPKPLFRTLEKLHVSNVCARQYRFFRHSTYLFSSAYFDLLDCFHSKFSKISWCATAKVSCWFAPLQHQARKGDCH